MLTINEMMQKLLANAIQNIYFEIHAVYEPDESEGFGDCFCAAVDLFNPGMTFNLYFTLMKGQIQVKHVEHRHVG